MGVPQRPALCWDGVWGPGVCNKLDRMSGMYDRVLSDALIKIGVLFAPYAVWLGMGLTYSGP